MNDERSIFNEAIVHPPGQERSAHLDRACGGQPELRARVDALLAAHEQANFLDSPPPGLTSSPDP